MSVRSNAVLIRMLAHEKQEQTNWCWVSCFRMACSQFGIASSQQCEIAGRTLGVTGCCIDGSTTACNTTLPEAGIPRTVRLKRPRRLR